MSHSVLAADSFNANLEDNTVTDQTKWNKCVQAPPKEDIIAMNLSTRLEQDPNYAIWYDHQPCVVHAVQDGQPVRVWCQGVKRPEKFYFEFPQNHPIILLFMVRRTIRVVSLCACPLSICELTD